MIGLVGLLARHRDRGGVEVLDRLPEPSRSLHSGYFVRCGQESEVEDVLEWYRLVKEVRPTLVLGLVCAPDFCAAALGRTTIPVHPVIHPDRIEDGSAPSWALSEIRFASVERRILQELVQEHGTPIMAERYLLEVLIANGIRGVTVERLSRRAGLSHDTVSRRLKVVGIQAGALVRVVRLRAYDLLVESGEPPASAVSACGWTSAKARYEARKRAGNYARDSLA